MSDDKLKLPDTPASEKNKVILGEVVSARPVRDAQPGRYLRDIIVVVVLGIIIVTLILAGMVIAGITAAKDIASDFGDGIGVCFFDCGPELIIRTGPILQTLQQQTWIEGVRGTNSFSRLYAEKDRVGPLGADSLYFDAIVIVTAGIDLEFFDENDIEVKDKDLIIRLPAPQVRDCIIDEQQSAFRDGSCAIGGILPTGVCEDLQIELRNQALRASANAEHDDLLEQAFEGASETVTLLLGDIEGVENLIIEKSSKEIPLFSEAGTCIDHQQGAK